MAIVQRAGGDSELWFGLQAALGTRISHAPETSATNALNTIIPKRFPFTDMGFDLASEQAQSRSITGRSASTKRAGGQLWCEGDIGTELLPDDVIDILRLYFNTSPTASEKQNAVITAVSGNLHLSIPATYAVPTNTADVTIKGWRRIGIGDELRPYVETIKSSATGAARRTKTYWARIDAIGSDANLATSDVDATHFDTQQWKTTLNGFSKGLLNGATLFMSKGGEPHWAMDVRGNTLELDVSDTISATAGLIGGRYEARQLLEGTAAGKIADTSGWRGDVYPFNEDLNFQPSWGTGLLVGTPNQSITDLNNVDLDTVEGRKKLTEVISLTTNINLNLESRRSYKISRYRGAARKTNTPREVLVTPVVFFESDEDDIASDVFQDWREIYIANATVPIKLVSYNWLDNGKEYRIEFEYRGCQLIEVPATPIPGEGDIERTLSFLSLPAAGGTVSNELVVNVYAGNYEYALAS